MQVGEIVRRGGRRVQLLDGREQSTAETETIDQAAAAAEVPQR